MPLSSLDINATVDRYINVVGYGHLLGLPTMPGYSSTAGTGVPTNGVKGFAPSAIFYNFKGTVGSLLYSNSGTYDSATWTNLL